VLVSVRSVVSGSVYGAYGCCRTLLPSALPFSLACAVLYRALLLWSSLGMGDGRIDGLGYGEVER
jgi:hypothetical protein